MPILIIYPILSNFLPPLIYHSQNPNPLVPYLLAPTCICWLVLYLLGSMVHFLISRHSTPLARLCWDLAWIIVLVSRNKSKGVAEGVGVRGSCFLAGRGLYIFLKPKKAIALSKADNNNLARLRKCNSIWWFNIQVPQYRHPISWLWGPDFWIADLSTFVMQPS